MFVFVSVLIALIVVVELVRAQRRTTAWRRTPPGPR